MTNEIYRDFNDFFNKLNSFKIDDTNNQQVTSKTNELINLVDRLKRKEKYEKLLFKLGIFLLIIGLIVLFWESLRIYFIYLVRFIFIYLYTVYDFTVFYYDNCLVKNPHYIKESRIKPNMCNYACGEKTANQFLKEYVLETNLTRDSFKEMVYANNVPIIINNDISSGKIKSIKSIVNNFLKDAKFLNDDDFCLYEASNFDDSIMQFLNRIFNNELKSYSSMWENCSKKSAKILKRLYSRPDYLPLGFELSGQSWMFISYRYKHNLYISVPISQRVVIFNQIKGKSNVRLSSEECKDSCKEQNFSLNKGQSMSLSDMWRIEFLPVDNDENVVLVLISS